jgi:hypothetical protein
VAVVAWAVLLVLVAYVSVRRDEPTVREQRTLGEAAQIVDRAVGELVVAAGAGVVVEMSGRRVEEGCRITPMRDGAKLTRTLTVRTAEAAEPPLLDRIARDLPPDYRAAARHGSGGTSHTLRADAGEFVAIRGTLGDPGVVTLTVTTGCRPKSSNSAIEAQPLIGLPVDDEPARVLSALGAAPRDPVDRVGAPCPGGGAVHTARASGQGTARAPLGEALRPLAGAGAVVVTDTPELYAYRDGSLSVVVERAEGDVRVAATAGCPDQ